MRLAHGSDIQGHNPILASKTLATDGPEEMPAIATAVVPPGQQGRFVGIEEAAAAAMSRLALRECRTLEISLHGAATEPDLVRDRLQRPALSMGGPDLQVTGHPLRPPRRGKGYRSCRWLLRGKRHGGEAGSDGRESGIVQRRGHGDALSLDTR